MIDDPYEAQTQRIEGLESAIIDFLDAYDHARDPSLVTVREDEAVIQLERLVGWMPR